VYEVIEIVFLLAALPCSEHASKVTSVVNRKIHVILVAFISEIFSQLGKLGMR